MNLALFSGSNHSIVTIGDCSGSAPAWQNALGWPAQGDRHIPFSDDSDAARNMFGVHLDQAVAQADRAVLLVASGVGCLAAAWWARLSPASYVSRVAGALLFAPEDLPGNVPDRFASPRMRLPFPSILIGPDPAVADHRLEAYATDWGSRLLGTDGVPPLRLATPARGGSLSPWRHARRTIERWSAAVVAHETHLAGALAGQNGAWRAQPKRFDPK